MSRSEHRHAGDILADAEVILDGLPDVAASQIREQAAHAYLAVAMAARTAYLAGGLETERSRIVDATLRLKKRMTSRRRDVASLH